jgi:hypothetical protein
VRPVGALFLGGAKALRELQMLYDFGIGAVLNVADNVVYSSIQGISQIFIYLFIIYLFIYTACLIDNLNDLVNNY